MERQKLSIIVAWLVEDPEAYKGKTNTDIEKEILDEAPTIPYVAKIEKVTVLDKPRDFFDRKVRIEGYTRTLSLGKVIPKDWRYARIQVMDSSPDDIVLRIRKLLGAEVNAQAKTAGEPSK